MGEADDSEELAPLVVLCVLCVLVLTRTIWSMRRANQMRDHLLTVRCHARNASDVSELPISNEARRRIRQAQSSRESMSISPRESLNRKNESRMLELAGK